MTAFTGVRLLGGMSFSDWTALVFVVGMIALWGGLQIVTWRRERRTWRTTTQTPGKVTRMHEEPTEAPPHQRAA